MAGKIPIIGAQFSALGLNEILAAMKKFGQSGQDAGAQAAGGMKLVEGQLDSLKELLPAISAALIVEGLREAVSGALEFGESMGKLSEKTGIGVGALSALSLAAKETNTDQESLEKGLVKLTKAMQDASNGVAKPKKAFADLGITLTDLKSKSPDQIFALLATKLQGIESPGLRAQAVMGIFGKAGADLIPVLNKVAEEGMGGLEEKAKRLGVYLSDDFVARAKAAKEGIADLQELAKGAALEFTSGLLPAIQGVSGALVNLSGENGFASLGSGFGYVITGVTAGVVQLIHFLDNIAIHAHGIFNDVKTASDYVLSHTQIQKSARDSYAAAYVEDQKYSMQDALKASDARYEASMKPLDNAYDQYVQPRMKRPQHTGVVGATGDGTSEEDAKKAAEEANKIDAARVAYQESLAQNELSLHKLMNGLQEADDKRSYDAGLTSLDDYYDQREKRIQQADADEYAALENKRAAAESRQPKDEAGQYKKREDLAKIDEEEAELAFNTDAKLDANEDARAKDRHDHALQQLEDEKKLQSATGDRYGAEKTALDIELQQYEELLQKQGKSVDEINAAVAAYKAQGTAKIAFEQNQESGSQAMAGLNQGLADISSRAENGSISQVSAQAQANQLQAQSVDTLQQIGLQMFKNAVLSQDPKNIEAANAYNAAVGKISLSLKNVTTAQTYLTDLLATQGRADVEDFFSSIIDGQKSASEAFADLAKDFEQMIAQMLSKMLIFYALESLIGFLPNGGGDFGKALSASGPFGSHATGGFTANVPTDQIAGVVHGQEWVATAAQTAKYKDLFTAISAGTALPAVTSVASAASAPTAAYAAQVAAQSAGAGATPVVNLIINNSTGEPVAQQKSTNASGGVDLKVMIGKVAVAAVATDMAMGGQTAKAVEGNYGLTRRGTSR